MYGINVLVSCVSFVWIDLLLWGLEVVVCVFFYVFNMDVEIENFVRVFCNEFNLIW